MTKAGGLWLPAARGWLCLPLQISTCGIGLVPWWQTKGWELPLEKYHRCWVWTLCPEGEEVPSDRGGRLSAAGDSGHICWLDLLSREACWWLRAGVLWRLPRLIWPLDGFSCFSSMWTSAVLPGIPGKSINNNNHTPLSFRKGQKDNLGNYRPHFNLWGNHQVEILHSRRQWLGMNGVTDGKSCLTNPVIFYNKITGFSDEKKAVHVTPTSAKLFLIIPTTFLCSS